MRITRFLLGKQPQEDTTFGVDFGGTRELQAGETLVAVQGTAMRGGVPVPEILSGQSIAGSQVRVRVRECEAGEYAITILATTNAGHVREADILLLVREA